MKIDMHVHTDRYSPCSHMSPEEMAQAALAAGLDGVVITEHNVQWSATEARELQAQFPALTILRGIEVSTAEGHALAYGVSDAVASTFYADIPLVDLTAAAHKDGGIVVLAHPARYEDRIPDDAFIAGIDAVEVMSTNIRVFMVPFITELRTSLRIPGITGSDGHAVESMGYYATDFHNRIRNETELVTAIKKRAFDVYCNQARVDAHNRDLTSQVAVLQRLLREDTLSQQEIRNQYHFSYSFQRGVRERKDMHLNIVCD